MVGLYVCLLISRLELWMANGWLARLVCSLFGMSAVSRSNHPAGLQSNQPQTDRPRTDRPPKHPPTGPFPTNQRHFFYKRPVLDFPLSGLNVPHFRPAGWLRKAAWPMPANHWSGLRSGSSSLYGDISLPFLMDTTRIDWSENTP